MEKNSQCGDFILSFTRQMKYFGAMAMGSENTAYYIGWWKYNLLSSIVL